MAVQVLEEKQELLKDFEKNSSFSGAQVTVVVGRRPKTRRSVPGSYGSQPLAPQLSLFVARRAFAARAPAPVQLVQRIPPLHGAGPHRLFVHSHGDGSFRQGPGALGRSIPSTPNGIGTTQPSGRPAAAEEFKRGCVPEEGWPI